MYWQGTLAVLALNSHVVYCNGVAIYKVIDSISIFIAKGIGYIWVAIFKAIDYIGIVIVNDIDCIGVAISQGHWLH